MFYKPRDSNGDVYFGLLKCLEARIDVRIPDQRRREGVNDAFFEFNEEVVVSLASRSGCVGGVRSGVEGADLDADVEGLDNGEDNEDGEATLPESVVCPSFLTATCPSLPSPSIINAAEGVVPVTM